MRLFLCSLILRIFPHKTGGGESLLFMDKAVDFWHVIIHVVNVGPSGNTKSRFNKQSCDIGTKSTSSTSYSQHCSSFLWHPQVLETHFLQADSQLQSAERKLILQTDHCDFWCWTGQALWVTQIVALNQDLKNCCEQAAVRLLNNCLALLPRLNCASGSWTLSQ